VAQPIATHYDSLQVQPGAPVEVIKASYRALSQKYHPDRNPDPGALGRMQVINQAWDVLSDPDKRATHDRWIAGHKPQAGPAPAPAAADAAPEQWLRKYVARLAGFGALALALLLGGAYLVQTREKPEPEPAAAANDSAVPDDLHPARQPHGYLSIPVWDKRDGPVSFEIDNSAGRYDAEVQLYRNGVAGQRVFVHHGLKFEVDHLAFGNYSIKYTLVTDGRAMHAYQARQVFALVQTADEAREHRYNKFNKARVTRFDVAAGKANADEIAPGQF
jgi:curved DNA-binding protein CbpA